MGICEIGPIEGFTVKTVRTSPPPRLGMGSVNRSEVENARGGVAVKAAGVRGGVKFPVFKLPRP